MINTLEKFGIWLLFSFALIMVYGFLSCAWAGGDEPMPPKQWAFYYDGTSQIWRFNSEQECKKAALATRSPEAVCHPIAGVIIMRGTVCAYPPHLDRTSCHGTQVLSEKDYASEAKCKADFHRVLKKKYPGYRVSEPYCELKNY